MFTQLLFFFSSRPFLLSCYRFFELICRKKKLKWKFYRLNFQCLSIHNKRKTHTLSIHKIHSVTGQIIFSYLFFNYLKSKYFPFCYQFRTKIIYFFIYNLISVAPFLYLSGEKKKIFSVIFVYCFWPTCTEFVVCNSLYPSNFIYIVHSD